eukprot:5019849-Prymnesium_polylepis.1
MSLCADAGTIGRPACAVAAIGPRTHLVNVRLTRWLWAAATRSMLRCRGAHSLMSTNLELE